MISAIRIQNLRSLKDTGFIELKPVNILVGANSSGKSTFLRAFLLLAQSVTKRLRGPIAWFDDALVDFGDFETSKNKNASLDEGIVFSFALKSIQLFRTQMLRLFRQHNTSLQTIIPDMEVSIHYTSDSKGAYIAKVLLNLASINVELSLTDRNGQLRMLIDGRENGIISYTWRRGLDMGLLPMLQVNPSNDLQPISSLESTLIEKTLSVLRKVCGKRFSHIHRLSPLIRMWTLDKVEFLKRVKDFDDIKSLNDNAKTWTTNTPIFVELYNGILGLYIYSIWPSISLDLANYFENCDYVAPLRAEAKRYYRNQGLQVNRIDSFGRNLSEFIDSLTETQRISYNDFVKRVLGIKIIVRNNTGHQTINLREGESEYNIADVGFGYSQILPIITKLWFVQERKRFNTLDYYRQPVVTSLIEQPELHLHPALQAKLADAILKAAIMGDEQNTKTIFIVESHSPTFINRIGRRIREGFVNPSDVSILVFNKDSNTGNTSVFHTQFNNRGQIKDWPLGFFDPEDDIF
jgi:hypothetical protein